MNLGVTWHRLRGALDRRHLLLACALVGAAMLPQRFNLLLRPSLPVLSAWLEPERQYELQLAGIPYALLRVAESSLPETATVLLVTSGADVRHSEYTTYHRALYFLAPRPIWWISPAEPDGTWESRWWISAPLTASSVSQVAAARGATFLLLDDVPWLESLGAVMTRVDGDALVALGDGPVPMVATPATLPAANLRRIAGLIVSIFVLFLAGHNILALIAQTGFRFERLEFWALAWAFGAGFTSLTMFWLDRAGIELGAELWLLTGVHVLWWAARQLLAWRRSGRMSQAGGRHNAAAMSHQAISSSFPSRSPFTWLLLVILGVQILFVTLLAMGRPLTVWDSWTSWGLRGRTIYLDGAISEAVYADPSRAVTALYYPLNLSLVDAWLYEWMGAADDRLVGSTGVLGYVALAVVCAAIVRRHGGSRGMAGFVLLVVASTPNVTALAGIMFADIPLAVLATIACAYLVTWLETRQSGALAIAVLAVGLLPWTKREGWLLVILICGLAVPYGGWRTRQAWYGAGAGLLGAIIVAGPWYALVASAGSLQSEFASLSLATLWAGLSRMPVVAAMTLGELLGPGWAFFWPLAAAAVMLAWRQKRARSWQALGRPSGLMLAVPIAYLLLSAGAYLLTNFAPFQQHVASSFYRQVAHVFPLAVILAGTFSQRSPHDD